MLGQRRRRWANIGSMSHVCSLVTICAEGQKTVNSRTPVLKFVIARSWTCLKALRMPQKSLRLRVDNRLVNDISKTVNGILKTGN